MLLQKAKVITTPTAYSDGILHSVKPSVVLGDELITNGDFSDGSTGWTISNGSIIDEKYVSGVLTAYQTGIKRTTFSETGVYQLTFDLT